MVPVHHRHHHQPLNQDFILKDGPGMEAISPLPSTADSDRKIIAGLGQIPFRI